MKPIKLVLWAIVIFAVYKAVTWSSAKKNALVEMQNKQAAGPKVPEISAERAAQIQDFNAKQRDMMRRIDSQDRARGIGVSGDPAGGADTKANGFVNPKYNAESLEFALVAKQKAEQDSIEKGLKAAITPRKKRP